MIKAYTMVKKFGFGEEKGFTNRKWSFRTSGYALDFLKENSEYTFYDNKFAVLKKEYRIESQHSLNNYIETCKKLKKAGYDRISSHQDCNELRDHFSSTWRKKEHEVYVAWRVSWLFGDESLTIAHSQWAEI